MTHRVVWQTLTAPGRSMQVAIAAGVFALLLAAGLAFTPVARADSDPNLIYWCSNGSFGFCGSIATDNLSDPSTQTLHTLLDSVPGPERPLFLQGIQSLGPYGAEGTLRIYSNYPPEVLQQEMAFLSNLIQNWPPDYQRALIIEYFQNQ